MDAPTWEVAHGASLAQMLCKATTRLSKLPDSVCARARVCVGFDLCLCHLRGLNSGNNFFGGSADEFSAKLDKWVCLLLSGERRTQIFLFFK